MDDFTVPTYNFALYPSSPVMNWAGHHQDTSEDAIRHAQAITSLSVPKCAIGPHTTNDDLLLAASCGVVGVNELVAMCESMKKMTKRIAELEARLDRVECHPSIELVNQLADPEVQAAFATTEK
jgi:hypothetical protein